MVHALDRAEARISEKGASPRGLLKVASPLGFGAQVVATPVPRFQAEHPEIEVFLRLSDYLVDLYSRGIWPRAPRAGADRTPTDPRNAGDPARLSPHGSARSAPFADMLVAMPAATAMTRSPALDRYNPKPGGRGPFADLFRAMRRAARGNNGVVVAAQSVEHQV